MNALDYFARQPFRLDELYHTNSKHAPGRFALATRLEAAERERRLIRHYATTRGRHKTYGGLGVVALPSAPLPLGSLDGAIATRRSQRRFGATRLSIEEVATLLLRSYGTCGAAGEARAVPSGGGLYPLDLYVLQPGDGPFPEGAYHYHVGEHVLQRVSRVCRRETVEAASIYPEIVGGAAMVLAAVADMRRSRVKYGERAYRLALLEAGHVSQNLYLVGTALGLGLVALDGFYDDHVHALLGVDGVCEIALALFAVGRRP